MIYPNFRNLNQMCEHIQRIDRAYRKGVICAAEYAAVVMEGFLTVSDYEAFGSDEIEVLENNVCALPEEVAKWLEARVTAYITRKFEPFQVVGQCLSLTEQEKRIPYYCEIFPRVLAIIEQSASEWIILSLPTNEEAQKLVEYLSKDGIHFDRAGSQIVLRRHDCPDFALKYLDGIKQ